MIIIWCAHNHTCVTVCGIAIKEKTISKIQNRNEKEKEMKNSIPSVEEISNDKCWKEFSKNQWMFATKKKKKERKN